MNDEIEMPFFISTLYLIKIHSKIYYPSLQVTSSGVSEEQVCGDSIWMRPSRMISTTAP